MIQLSSSSFSRRFSSSSSKNSFAAIAGANGSRTLLLAALSLSVSYGFLVQRQQQQQSSPSLSQQQQTIDQSAFSFLDSSTAAPSTTALFHNKQKKRTSGGGGGFGSSPSNSADNDAAAQNNPQPPVSNKVMDRFPYSGTVRPGTQSPQRVVVDERIVKPDYAVSGTPSRATKPLLPWMVEVKSPQAIEQMRAAGKLARHVLDTAGRAVRPGITTDQIDQIVHDEIVKNNAYPSPLNYHGFPKSCCTSVNEVICHGIPDDRPLQLGDIVNLDITVYLNGYHGDCSEMFVVGGEAAASPQIKNLLQTTYDCWIAACQMCQPGRHYKEIGGIIEDYVVPRGFSTVRNFCGHGIGAVFHTNPNILHYRNNEPNGQMAAGHTFTIEPMICEGSAKALTWPDEWTATTVDGKRSAQFEHTLLITQDGVEALTGKLATSPIQFWERDCTIHKGIWLGTSKDAKHWQDEINKAFTL